MKGSVFVVVLIALNTMFLAVGTAQEKESLGTISSSGGRTATITKMEQRDGAVYLTVEGEAIIDVSKSTLARKAELEKGKPYVLPDIKAKRPFSYVLTERTEGGLVVWKGTMMYVLLATQHTLPLYDQQGATVTMAPQFKGEVTIAGRTLKPGDTWKIGSETIERVEPAAGQVNLPRSTDLGQDVRGAEKETPKRPEPSLGSMLPPFKQPLKGHREIRVRNPNDFVVHAGVRKDEAGVNLEVPANGTRSTYVPGGKYEIYFVYSSKPDALFKGDDFTLDGHGVEIQIVKVVGGNYGIRRVK